MLFLPSIHAELRLVNYLQLAEIVLRYAMALLEDRQLPNNEFEKLPAGPICLRNVVCPYCGARLGRDNSTKEHMVGRKFVPKGSLENQPNLILRACRSCNNRKSDLEDDISAITMQPDVTGRYFGSSESLVMDAERKANASLSRHTGKPVRESKPTIEIKHEIAPGVTMTFNFVGQAQISDERAQKLALFHFQACFFFITYSRDAHQGWWWVGEYAPIQVASKLDWGNDLAVAFMERTLSWDYRFLMITADENFKIAIRKSLDSDVWSLAVEWNENYRVLAACGEPEALKAFVAGLPKLNASIVSRGPNWMCASRSEKQLKSEADTLFAVSADQSTHPTAVKDVV
jgi:hypothetical protein